jgi:hypothetical protein
MAGRTCLASVSLTPDENNIHEFMIFAVPKFRIALHFAYYRFIASSIHDFRSFVYHEIRNF